MKEHYSNSKRHADTLLANFLVQPILNMYLLNVDTLKLDCSRVQVRVSDQKGRILWEGKILDIVYATPCFIAEVWFGEYPLESIVVSFRVYYPRKDQYGEILVNCNVDAWFVTCSVGVRSNNHFQMKRDRMMPYGMQRKIKGELFRMYVEEMVVIHLRGPLEI